MCVTQPKFTDMGTTGRILFWIGFSLTISIVIAYIITMIVDVTCFTSWITSLSLCGIVLLGAILMLVGRSLERKYDDEV